MQSFKTIINLSIIALMLFAFCSCSVTRKISAADILSKTKLEFESLTLDSVSINKDLFPKTGLFSGGLLPNPQVIAMVQDFAKGILEKEIGTAGLSVGAVAINQGRDTLWIKKLTAVVKLDSLMELPVELKDSIKMVPGENRFTLVTQMPLDKRLFRLMDVNTLKFAGRLDVSLKESAESFPLDFDLERKVSPEEKQALAEKARTSVLNGIINDWVGAILPNN